ncbi:MAG: alpha/beta hydrolase [Rhodospirillaceae bacterium]|nr:alpha/beta hydrolase [Rhodospirillaceae bacterium]
MTTVSQENASTIPDWFQRAIERPTNSRFVDVDGCPIHYLTWFDGGDDLRPGLLFIHGGGAHANWWRFIAPFFAETYRVAAIDLSGMGDSGARDNYLPETWAREVGAVLEDAQLGALPVVVGHSFGGLIAMKYGADHGEKLSGTVIVDSPVQDPDDIPIPKPEVPVPPDAPATLR